MHTCQAHKHKRRQLFLASSSSSSPVSLHVLSHFKPFLPPILSFNPLIPHLLCLLTPSFLTFSVGDVLQYSRLLLCGCGFSGYAHGGRVRGLLHKSSIACCRFVDAVRSRVISTAAVSHFVTGVPGTNLSRTIGLISTQNVD